MANSPQDGVLEGGETELKGDLNSQDSTPASRSSSQRRIDSRLVLQHVSLLVVPR